jgi:hypothetical protein
MLKRVSAALCLLALAPAGLRAMEWKQALDLDLRGAYQADGSGLDSTVWTSTGAVNGHLMYVPGLTLGADAAFLPVLGVVGTGQGVDLPDQGLFTESIKVLARPQYRQTLQGGWSLDLAGDASHTYYRQGSGETLGQDLLDNEQYGGIGGFDWRGQGLLTSFDANAELLRRHYPNWRDPLAPVVQNLNFYDRDYWGPKISLAAASVGKHGAWGLSVDYQHKRYTDCLVYDRNGQLSPDTQRNDDWIQLGGHVDRSRGSWTLSLQGQWEDTESNQNYYDSSSNYVANFYSFNRGAGGLNLTWRSPSGNGAYAMLAGDWSNLVYIGRLIRNRDGGFAAGVQEDFEQTYSLSYGWPLIAHTSLVGSFSYDNVASNSQYAVTYNPSYTLLGADLGLRVQY